MICPRPESCDAPRALMSVAPNLCCDETEPRNIHLPDIYSLFPFLWGQFLELWQLMLWEKSGHHVFNFSTLWRFQYLLDSSQDMAQNIIYSPWEETKGPWPRLMTKLLSGLLWLFSFVSAFFSLLWIKLGGGGLVVKSCPTLAIPWTVACQAPLSRGFSRQEYRVGFHFLLQRIFPTQEWNPSLLHCRQMI